MHRWRVVGWAAGVCLGCVSAHAQQFSTPEPGATPPATGDAAADKTVITAAGIKLPSGLYDEKADPVKDISRARDRAKKDGRNVIIMWGENNCEFCVHLYRLYSEDPRIKQLMQTEFELVKVDIGKFEKNLELAKNVYDTDLISIGAPDLTVVNPATNQALAIMAGKDALHKPMTLQRIFDADYVFNFLDKNKPAPRPAVPLLMEAQQKAKRDNLRVLAYFNVYGSDACAMWDRLARSPDAAAILEKAFVLRKIDVDRHPGGSDLLRRIKGNSTATPPWMTVLDSDGKPVSAAAGGHEFDPGSSLPTVVEWLAGAADGKLNSDDKAALTRLIEQAVKPEPAAPH